MEGFGQVIIRPQVQSVQLIFQRVFSGDNNDPGPRFQGFKLFDDFKPASAWQADISYDSVIIVVIYFIQGLWEIRGGFADIPLLLQVFPYVGLEGRFVFYDQNFHYKWYYRDKSKTLLQERGDTGYGNK
jgi:hypothetical protein